MVSSCVARKRAVCKFHFLHNVWRVGGNRGGERRTEEEKEGSGWDGGLVGAEVYRRAIVTVPASVCQGSIVSEARLPSLTSSAASCTLAEDPRTFPSPQRRGVGVLIHLLNPPISVPHPQVTRLPTGSTLAPRGRNAAPIQNTKRWNWRRNFCSTCTSPGTAGTRWPDCSTLRRGRSRSGSRTAG